MKTPEKLENQDCESYKGKAYPERYNERLVRVKLAVDEDIGNKGEGCKRGEEDDPAALVV